MKDAPYTSRLAHLETRTPAETACGDLIAQIEHLGAHPLLTESQQLIDEAMRTLGFWKDQGAPGGDFHLQCK